MSGTQAGSRPSGPGDRGMAQRRGRGSPGSGMCGRAGPLPDRPVRFLARGLRTGAAPLSRRHGARMEGKEEERVHADDC